MTPPPPAVVHELATAVAAQTPDAPALETRSGKTISYRELLAGAAGVASALRKLDMPAGSRVAVYAPKRFETVALMLGCSAAGMVFIPVNPALRAAQVAHILGDSGASVLATVQGRIDGLLGALADCPNLRRIWVIDGPAGACHKVVDVEVWPSSAAPDALGGADRLTTDLAAILYTSGSTGRPKGVVLTHGNITCGAASVAQYLALQPSDRILAVLPLSFDYGLNQITSALLVGATTVLLDFLLPRDVVSTVRDRRITGLAAVPPLWISLSEQEWPEEAVSCLRYITNSGGAMPPALLERLRTLFPGAQVFLMYGLTEAFRSTYLPPDEIDTKRGSMGRAIPFARLSVRRTDGTLAEAGEVGELVHEGPLVAAGYWGDAERTAARFRPVPETPIGHPAPPPAVWSGDLVRADADGYLYFLGRNDEMIKSSGYRISPAEVEEVALATGLVTEAVAFGVPDDVLGQRIILEVGGADSSDGPGIRKAMAATLPAWMVPAEVRVHTSLPRNPNGKFDRSSLSTLYCAEETS